MDYPVSPGAASMAKTTKRRVYRGVTIIEPPMEHRFP